MELMAAQHGPSVLALTGRRSYVPVYFSKGIPNPDGAKQAVGRASEANNQVARATTPGVCTMLSGKYWAY